MLNRVKQQPVLVLAIIMAIAILWNFYVQLIWGYNKESWNITEFLVNYQGGFVRRGLIGEVIYFLSKNYSLNPYYLIVGLCAVCYFGLIVVFIRSFIEHGFSLLILPFVFFLGSPVINNFWVRKDVLIVLLYIFIIHLLQKQTILRFFILNIILCIALLIHESIAFLAFPVIAWKWYKFSAEKQSGSSLKAILMTGGKLLFPLLVFGTLFLFPAKWDTAEKIWYSWDSFKFPSDSEVALAPAAIEGITWSAQTGLRKTMLATVQNFSGGVYAPFAWLFIVLGVFVMGRYADKLLNTGYGAGAENEVGKKFTEILVFNFICLMPLYIISLDYGRWVFLWVTSSYALLCFNKSYFPDFIGKTGYWLGNIVTGLFRDSRFALFFLFCLGLPKFEWDYNQFFDSTPVVYILRFVTKIITLYLI